MFDARTGVFSVIIGDCTKTPHRDDGDSAGRRIAQRTFDGPTSFDGVDARDFLECTFVGASFRDGLTDNLFERCRFVGCGLQNTALRGVGFDTCSFDDRPTSFKGSILSDVQFLRCNLRGAEFMKADLFSTSFHQCRIENVDLSEAVLSHRASRKVTYTRLVVCDSYCRRIDFSGRVIGNAQMYSSQFDQCTFERSDLTGASFRGSALNDVDLALAILDHADFFDAEFDGTDVAASASHGGCIVNGANAAPMLKALGFAVRLNRS